MFRVPVCVGSQMQKFLALIAVVAACGGPARSTTPPPAPPTTTPTPPTQPIPAGGRRAAADAKPMVRATAPSAACGKLSAALAEDGSLLADRMRLRVPKGAGELARAHNIMSSPRPSAEETRLMHGGGKSAGASPGDQAFVVFAKELWQLDPDVAKAEADAIVKPASFRGGAEVPHRDVWR